MQATVKAIVIDQFKGKTRNYVTLVDIETKAQFRVACADVIAEGDMMKPLSLTLIGLAVRRGDKGDYLTCEKITGNK